MQKDSSEFPMHVYSVFPQKCAVIIDGGYWEKIRESLGNPEIDLLKLSEFLSKPAYRMRTYYFDGKHKARQSVHDQLEMLERFEVILGDVVEREIKCHLCKKSYKIYEQKRVDVMIAVNLVHLASTKQVDTIVLLAGDRDFLPVVEVAKTAGVVIRLAYGIRGSSKVAPGLLKSADERIKITESLIQPFKIKTEEETIEKEKIEALFVEDRHDLLVQVEDAIKELIKTKGKDQISPGELGFFLKEKGIQFIGTLTNLLGNLKENIILVEDGESKKITIQDEKEIALLINIGLKEDKAALFLFKTLNELLKEVEETTIPVIHLNNSMYQKNPDWKKEYHYPKNKSITKLINRSKQVLEIKGDDFPSSEIGFKDGFDYNKFLKD